MKDKSIKLVKHPDNRFLTACMPDGQVIPMQVDLHMKQLLEQPEFVRVQVTLNCDIPIEDFEILKHEELIKVTSSNT